MNPSCLLQLDDAFSVCPLHKHERQRFFCLSSKQCRCIACLLEDHAYIQLRRNMYSLAVAKADLEHAMDRNLSSIRTYLCNGEKVVFTAKRCGTSVTPLCRSHKGADRQFCSLQCYVYRSLRKGLPKRAVFE